MSVFTGDVDFTPPSPTRCWKRGWEHQGAQTSLHSISSFSVCRWDAWWLTGRLSHESGPTPLYNRWRIWRCRPVTLWLTLGYVDKRGQLSLTGHHWSWMIKQNAVNPVNPCLHSLMWPKQKLMKNIGKSLSMSCSLFCYISSGGKCGYLAVGWLLVRSPALGDLMCPWAGLDELVGALHWWKRGINCKVLWWRSASYQRAVCLPLNLPFVAFKKSIVSNSKCEKHSAVVLQTVKDVWSGT